MFSPQASPQRWSLFDPEKTETGTFAVLTGAKLIQPVVSLQAKLESSADQTVDGNNIIKPMNRDLTKQTKDTDLFINITKNRFGLD